MKLQLLRRLWQLGSLGVPVTVNSPHARVAAVIREKKAADALRLDCRLFSMDDDQMLDEVKRR